MLVSFFFLSFFFYGNQERRLRGSTKSRSRRWPFLARIPSGAVVRSPAVSTRDALVTRKNRRGWRLTGPSTLSTRERRWKIHRGEKSHGAKGRIQRFQRGEIAKGRARWPEEKKSYSIEEPVLGRSTRPPIPLRKVNASKRREDTIDPRDPLSKYRETARKKRPSAYVDHDEVNMYRLRRRPERHWLATITISRLCPLLSSSSSSSRGSRPPPSCGKPESLLRTSSTGARGCIRDSLVSLDRRGSVVGSDAPVFPRPLPALKALRTP